MGRKKITNEVTGYLQPNKGTLYMVVCVYDEDGNRRRFTRSTRLKAKGNVTAAKSMLHDYIEEIKQQLKDDKKEQISPDSLFSKIVDDYLEYAITRVSENTLEKYTNASRHIKKYFDAQGTTIKNLTTEDISKYQSAKHKGDPEKGINGLSANTLSYHKTVINGSILYAIEVAKVITENPALSVSAPKKYRRLPSYYTGEQLNEVFDLMKEESILPVVVLTATFGFRRQEVLGMRWAAIDLDNECIHVRHTATKVGKKIVYADRTKSTSSLRSLNIPESTSLFLKKLYAHQRQMRVLCKTGYNENDYVCKWADGRPFSPDYISSKWRKLLKKYGLPHIRFHDLRHSAASLLLANGYSLKEIQKYLGHADIKSTDVYTHLQPAAKKNMAKTMDSALTPPM